MKSPTSVPLPSRHAITSNHDDADCDDLPLVVVLAHAYRRDLSGTIVVGNSAQPPDAIYVHRGAPAKASTSEVVAPLGEVLIAMGSIDEETLIDGYEIACDTSVRLGQSLVERGVIDRDVLDVALASQLEEKLLSLLNRGAAPCRFIEDTDLIEDYGELLEVPCEPLEVIMEGIRRLRGHPHLHTTMQTIGDAHLVIRPDVRIERMGLRLEIPVIQRLLDGPATCDQLAREHVATEEVIRRTVYALALVGFVDVVQNLQPIARARSDRRVRRAAAKNEARLTRGEIEERLRQIDEGSGAEVLGVRRGATIDEVWDAFLAASRKWHPDNLPAELSGLRPEVERIFACVAGTYAERRKSAPKRRSRETSASDAMDALELFQKAGAAADAGRLAEAEALVRRALALEPHELEYRTLLAAVLARRAGDALDLCETEPTNRYAIPIRMLEHVLADDPEYERARLQRGILLAQSGRPDEALADFEHILRFNPHHVRAAARARQARLAIARSRKLTQSTSRLSNGRSSL